MHETSMIEMIFFMSEKKHEEKKVVIYKALSTWKSSHSSNWQALQSDGVDELMPKSYI